MDFMEQLHHTLNHRKTFTENGAAGYAATGKALADINFAAASLRHESEEAIVRQFLPAFFEDRTLAVKWLFFLRDVRGGLGERRSFHILFRYLAGCHPELVRRLTELVAEYGRFDDLLCLFGTPAEDAALSVLQRQLVQDDTDRKAAKPISLCAKWMPGNNASSAATRRDAAKLQRFMGLTAKEYRKLLASLRSYLQVTEVLMSSGRWDEINYEQVPSKANLLYRNAFFCHDETRRRQFLESLTRNDATIHADVLMPHEIVTQYKTPFSNLFLMGNTDDAVDAIAEDAALEALWRSLPDTVSKAKNILCVVDGSGSMTCRIGSGNVTALHVSNALGIYFAERLEGPYRNRFITFSNHPQYVDLSPCQTLAEKLTLAYSHTDCSNTNLEATFELVLETAVKHHLTQKELPQTILVISDMEFDAAVYGRRTDTLFDTIKKRFARHGYRMPKLVFWNVNSRTNVFPVRENELGIGLVSGFSVNICKMVLSNELDPYQCLKQILESERYDAVAHCLSKTW